LRSWNYKDSFGKIVMKKAKRSTREKSRMTPRKLKIGAHTYKLKFIEPSEIEDGASCGVVDKNKGIIYLDTRKIDSEIGVSLIHEVLHVINDQMSHSLIEALAQQLYAFLVENGIFRIETKDLTKRK
jgi:hypothetical protein